MGRLWLAVLCAGCLLGCAAPAPYAWQDTRQPAREDATADLEECRAYTARQYRPGMPAGDSYLRDQAGTPGETTGSGQGTWRPDRDPFAVTNVNALPAHHITVPHTGYPGELDYHPGYLDDILEKCMKDRGWTYQAVSGSP